MAEWSSYLKQAVANVEQRLDQVLQESKEVSLPKRTDSPVLNTPTPDAEPKPTEAKATSRRPDLSERMKKVVSKSSTPVDSETVQEAAGSQDQTSDEPKEQLKEDEIELKVDGHNTPQAPSPEPASKDSDQEPVELERKEPPKPRSVSPPAASFALETFKSDFAAAPDLHPALLAARDLALALNSSEKTTGTASTKDAALDLAELMEKANRDQSEFINHIGDRFTSLHSKIQVLSEPHFGGADKLEEKVALLMDEGRRLSEQELKLSTYVRKLRAGLREKETKADQLAQKNQELDRKAVLMSAERDVLSSEKRELEALVEHYRTQAEPYSNKSESAADQARLESLEAAHAAIRASWQDRELELLQRAAELEASADNSSEAFRQVNSKLSDRLKEAQTEARTAHEHVVLLQEELDRRSAKIAELEATTFANRSIPEVHESDRETTAVPQLEPEPSSPNAAVANSIGGAEDSLDPIDKCGIDDDLAHDISVIDEGPSSISLLCEEDEIVVSEPEHHAPTEDRFIDLGPTESPFNTTRQSSLGSLLVDTPERDITFDGHSADMSQSDQLHVVARLSKTVRKLQSELSATRKAAELATHQREEAQNELVRLLDIQDELEIGKSEREDLEKQLEQATEKLRITDSRLNERTERISELEADVQDLKVMYREQIEALVQEISRLSTDGAAPST